jgi:hypothetical protein
MIPGTDHSTTNVVEKWFYRVKGSLHTYTVVGGKITDVDVERAAP